MTALGYQTKEKEIGDCTYIVEPLGFIDARKAMVRLGNILGPALGALATTSKSGEAMFADAASALLTKLSDDDLAYFQALFAAKTQVKLSDGKQPLLKDIIVNHFSGARFMDFFSWLVFCLQVNYGDFFKGAWEKVKSALPTPPMKTQSRSTSQMESNGPNGGSLPIDD